jgi:glycosyltransferase involved in cell wall biosynthesis
VEGEAPLGIVHFPPEVDVNPYTRLLYGELAAHGFELREEARLELRWLSRSRSGVSVLHFHWCPNDLYEHRARSRRLAIAASWAKLPLFAGRLAAARALGYTLVWTIHEIHPHVSLSRRLDRIAGRALARLSHVLLAHDRETAARAARELGIPADAVEVVPHGSYGGFYRPGRVRHEVREELGLAPDAFAFLCFGTLKPYKRLELLLEAFHGVDDARAALVVAGIPRDPGVTGAVLAAAAADRRIRPQLGLVPDERVAELFGACDAVVLPRADGWTSGSLILALTLGLPVVAARTPAYEALVGGEAGWWFDAGSAPSLRLALRTALDEAAHSAAKGRAARKRAELLSWADCAERTSHLVAAARSRTRLPA